jgi:uncharacterized protein
MSVEVRPLGVKCNLRCSYCYQNPQRDAHNVARNYDLDAMKRSIETAGGPFTLFGGEALMVPDGDLEALWAWGLERYGGNGIQTNGALITERHIALFQKYKVHVGISIDGPGALNDVRWAGTLEATRQATRKTEAAIERLCQAGSPPSLIATLHRANATAEQLPAMHEWIRTLARQGITSMRLHVLEVDDPAVRARYALTDAENVAALLSFAALEPQLAPLQFDLFADIKNLLVGHDGPATCVWRGCDPYTTRAVQGVEGFGQQSNCGRTNKEGIDFVKSDIPGFERYIALYHTPQEHGGCQSCRFFLMCKGQCPGTAIAGDWRNRSEHCGVWKELFAYFEARMCDKGYAPLSLRPERAAVETALLAGWLRGRNRAVEELLPHGVARADAVPAWVYGA